MKIINTRIFYGKNIYSHKPCIRLDLDLEGYAETPSKDIKYFNTRLVKLIPEVREHRCGIDEDFGFLKRLTGGTYLAHICEHIIIGLQNRLGIEVSYGKAREIEGDLYYLIFQFKYEKTALLIADLAIEIENSLIEGKIINLNKKMKKIQEVYSDEMLGPSTQAIVDEAYMKNIPVIRLGDKSMVQLGYGSKARRVQATLGPETNAVSMEIVCDKYLTKDILSKNFIPVAQGGIVNDKNHLLSLAEEIGFPVVIKPRYGNHGNGVYANIKTKKDLLDAYKFLLKEYENILIEKHIEGSDYRVTLINYNVSAVSKRLPPTIVGDGVSTIKQLIKRINADPLRGEGHEKPLTKIIIDEKLISNLKEKDLTINDIPNVGEEIVLRNNANLSTGGSAIDCTDLICRENIRICQRAARAVNMDICGIDICCKDISEPITRTNGAILEINASPGIRMHLFPTSGDSKNIGKDLLDLYYKDGYENIPIVAVTGTNGKTTTTRLIVHILRGQEETVGMTTTNGIYINDECIEEGDTTGYTSAMSILLNREVDAAVLETARGGLIRRGLAYEEADVAVITNITEDHLGLDGVNSMEELAKVKALVIEAVKSDGYCILNADDKWSMTIKDRSRGNIILFSKTKDNQLIKDHLNSGNKAVFIENGYVCFEQNNILTPIIKINEIPITLKGKLEHNIENALAAITAVIALNVDLKIIQDRLKSFLLDEKYNYGRFNLFNINGVTVILDYGHNIEGYRCTLESLNKLNYNNLIGVIGMPGDRTNDHIMEVGKISTKFFSRIIIKEDEDKRGRKEGEVAKLLKKSILQEGYSLGKVNICLKEKNALRKALSMSQPGDCIVIFYENYKLLQGLIEEYRVDKKLKAVE
ncbi:MAG: cyanophycin synthetase [Oscillospiraceae bacterium]|nr:cyanophycin synthetase [Oscillospiraceae bacterium]